MKSSFAKSMVLLAFFLVGCAHSGRLNTQKEASNETENGSLPSSSASNEGSSSGPPVSDVESFRLSDPEPPTVAAPELEAIPEEVNEKVEQWLKYFQGPRGRIHMERYLSRMTRYSALMKRILKRNGLPEDLIYIALIESGFSSKATSHAAAVGYWQFIRGTGKRYGLEINTLVDERRDPVLSTQAASEYYRDLYSEFNSWYLAMAAYNVGENRVRREINKNATKDFWKLVKKRRLPRETMNYVPKYIAARMIGKDPAKYGFADIEYERPIEFELIRFDKPVNLKSMAEKMQIDYEDLKILNPKFRGEIAPTKESGVLELKVPLTMSQVALNAARESVVDRVEYVADTGDTDIYRVRRGDSLFSIARKYRTTIGWLKDVNDLKPGRKLKIGQRMIVPVPGSSGKALAQSRRKTPPEPQQKEVQIAAQTVAVPNSEVVSGSTVYYIVQPGDTLSEIAEEYDSTVKELRKMNRLSKRVVLRPGMKLKVPKDEGLPEDPSESNGSAVNSSGVTGSAKVDSANETEAPGIKGEQPDGDSSEPKEAVDGDEKTSRSESARFARSASRNPAAARLKQKQVKLRQGTSVVRREAVQKPSKKAKVTAKKAAPAKTSFVHRVRRGENLSSIAAKYDVPYAQLIRKNSRLRDRPLYVGAQVIVPVSVK